MTEYLTSHPLAMLLFMVLIAVAYASLVWWLALRTTPKDRERIAAARRRQQAEWLSQVIVWNRGMELPQAHREILSASRVDTTAPQVHHG